MKAKITEFKMLQHMAFANEHSSLSKGTIQAEGHELDQKEIIKETHTKRVKTTGEFKGSKSYFYLNELGSKVFNSVEKFMEYYKIQ